jgi:hypothetical protein
MPAGSKPRLAVLLLLIACRDAASASLPQPTVTLDPISIDGATSADEPDVAPRPVTSLVTFTPEPGHAMHEHGGHPAQLYDAKFTVHNGGSQPAVVNVTRVDFLESYSCDVFPNTLRSSPKPQPLRVTVPAGSTMPLEVHFSGVPAYEAWCERFAFRVTFDVDGTAMQSTAETHVVRIEPLNP